MTFLHLRHACAPAAALILAQAAQADVSAQDVWSDWQTYFNGIGYEISATQSQSGDALTLNDVTLTSPESSEAGSIVMRLDQLRFENNDDGTVSVVFPEVMPFEIRTIDPDGATSDGQMELRQTGMTTLVSGAPTDMTSTYTAQTLEMVLTGLTVEGETISSDDAALRVVMDGVSGSTQTTVGGKRVYDQRMQATAVDYDITFADPDGSGRMDLNGKVDGLGFSGGTALPLAVVNGGDVSALLSAGMTANGTFRYSGGAANMSVTENAAEVFSGQTSSTGGTLDVVMGADGLSYSGDQNNLKVTMTTQDFPAPIDFDMAKASFNLAMPVQKSETADDFAVGFSLNDFSMSELLWGMFDPKAQLPRDPATVALDLTGKARLLFDFLDPSAAMMSGDPDITPAELESVTINRLQITAAGAELTGEGAFTFESETPATGLQPQGAADLTLVGGNKLIDSLVAMGLLPEDQAMGARMMMGLLAVPGKAPDTLNSKIEINEQGHILANGQRIQ